MKKAIILGSSKGIGMEIANSLRDLDIELNLPTSKELDTSNIESVKIFLKKNKKTDILVLNTGGPPALDFFKINQETWFKYYNQLFYGFVLILQKLIINKNGYIFLISSHTIKNPEQNLVLSNAYRVALTSILKTISKIYSKRNINCINIAPGPIKTKRLQKLVKNIKKFEKELPMLRSGDPKEIGNFIKLIVEYEIKYLNGVTINFDGGLSDNIFG